jgi:ATP synthase protein I
MKSLASLFAEERLINFYVSAFAR